ncbi:hypothetical protein ElyMa_000391300 [Elysia marginata]|uniref:Uncharacterized protein n=1 Tax=Elysia marginata TaxID=1093978 RepID=A0AAV4FKU6_9GAST|nr:hypothetical protein ElyMa_000391300 [Elysia marginata]
MYFGPQKARAHIPCEANVWTECKHSLSQQAWWLPCTWPGKVKVETGSRTSCRTSRMTELTEIGDRLATVTSHDSYIESKIRAQIVVPFGKLPL